MLFFCGTNLSLLGDDGPSFSKKKRQKQKENWNGKKKNKKQKQKAAPSSPLLLELHFAM